MGRRRETAMTPQVQDDIKQDFIFTTLPSKTFKMNLDSLTVMGTVDQMEALLQSVYLILNTERYFWLIFSWNYGVQLHDLIGKDSAYCIPEIERRIREALLQDDRITAVENFHFERNKRQVTATFTVVSIFGKVDIKKVVEI